MQNFAPVNQSVLEKLIRHFYNGSLDFYLQPEEVESLTWETQQNLIDNTVNNEMVKKYPVSSKFCQLYFKKLIMQLEASQEVHDEVYIYLCKALQSNSEHFCYRHYINVNEYMNKITLKETKNLVVNGTTGMRTWQAAKMLADFIITHKELFIGKRLIELGSGVGFTGISILKYCDIKSILLTDCHTDVLKTMCDNIQINFPNMELDHNDTVKIFRNGNKKSIGVMMLDWNCFDGLPNIDEAETDVLIGADIIYDPAILEPLCGVIKTLILKNENLEVYLSNVIRNEDTFKQFLKTLDDMNLEAVEICHNKNVYIEWDENIKMGLFKIKLDL